MKTSSLDRVNSMDAPYKIKVETQEVGQSQTVFSIPPYSASVLMFNK